MSNEESISCTLSNADKDGTIRHSYASLQATWHHLSVCSAQCAGWHGDWDLLPATSTRGISEVPAQNRPRNAPRVGPSLDLEQLWDAQPPSGETMAEEASTVPSALYPDECLVDEFG